MSIFIVAASILAALTEWNPQAICVPRTARIGAVKAQQPGRQSERTPIITGTPSERLRSRISTVLERVDRSEFLVG
ncbi:hypothetical protein ABZ016_07455 [Streptomyces sp. NPDC006372]|uniref:hypothetical protein n=1 Tax=Streptomyces sp. NPDC006372 TaxID=3155599 RepID=UPI0033A799DE